MDLTINYALSIASGLVIGGTFAYVVMSARTKTYEVRLSSLFDEPAAPTKPVEPPIKRRPGRPAKASQPTAKSARMETKTV
jgi:hypothetical protein